MIGVGITIQPEERYLALLDEAIRSEADYLEMAPETTWKLGASGDLEPNGFHQVFADLQRETAKPMVAHGVGFSLGNARRDPQRDARWLTRVQADHERFQFLWYTDHLGVTMLDGHELALPLPLPMVEEAAEKVRAGLAALQFVVPDVGFENSVFYYHLGDPLDEPAWIGSILCNPRTHLLLDLHNVHTSAENGGFDAREYLARLPLERVIEIHLSGGSYSEPSWLASGRSLRLDSHDSAVPDAVWSLFEEVLGRCPDLRGVTLERMEGTLQEDDAPLIIEELRRIRRTMELARV